MNWRQAKIVAFDLETTGFDPIADRILQIAFTIYDPILDAYTPEFVTTCGSDGAPIDPNATYVHGISEEDVAGLLPADARLGQLQDFLWDAMQEDHVYVGFNAPFDLAFLLQAFKRKQLECPINPMRVVDPLTFARGQWPFNRLRELALRLEIPLGRMHEAVKDVRLTVPVLLTLADKLSLPTDLDELLVKQEECITAWEKKSKHKYRDTLYKVWEPSK